jgi:hypothetical protein
VTSTAGDACPRGMPHTTGMGVRLRSSCRTRTHAPLADVAIVLNHDREPSTLDHLTGKDTIFGQLVIAVSGDSHLSVPDQFDDPAKSMAHIVMSTGLFGLALTRFSMASGAASPRRCPDAPTASAGAGRGQLTGSRRAAGNRATRGPPHGPARRPRASAHRPASAARCSASPACCCFVLIC